MTGSEDLPDTITKVAATSFRTQWDWGVLCIAVAVTAGMLVTQVPWLSAAAVEPPVSKPLADYSTQELQQAERTEDVAAELLRRTDVTSETALAAVRRLAAIRGMSPATVLAERMSQLDHSSPLAVRRNLVDWVSQLEPQSKHACCEAAERLVATTGSDAARQTAMAARMMADRDSSVLFATAQQDAEQLADFLLALPLVSDNSVQRQAYRSIRPLLDAGAAGSHHTVTEPQVQALVLRIIVQWEGDEVQKAGDAMRLLCSGQCQMAAMEALVALPSSSWPEQQLGQTAAAVIAWLAENRPTAGNSADHATALTLCDKLGPCFSDAKRTRFENRLREITSR